MTNEPSAGGSDIGESADADGDAVNPRVPSDTVGTGSYVAVTCSVLAVLATLLLIAGLLISRWLF